MTTSLTSIVAVGLNGEIGVNNDLPWRLKSDLKFFKQTTMKNIVIMGRKTFDSIGKCLPGRENIVLSHRASLFEQHKGCHQAHGIGETLYLREKMAKKQAFVIGGAQTYAEFAPYVDRYLITFVNSSFPEADSFFREDVIGNNSEWTMSQIDVERDSSGDEFDFNVFELLHRNPEDIAEARRRAISSFQERNHLLQRKAMKLRARSDMKLDQPLSFA